ncbi:hypothetical protein ACOME3_003337 [Neoechinorhynchus agilis]
MLSVQVASYKRHFPRLQGKTEKPLGLLSSDLHRLLGSKIFGMLMEVRALLRIALISACLGDRPVDRMHDRACNPLASTCEPQRHSCEKQMGAPSLKKKVTRNVSSAGIASSQAPNSFVKSNEPRTWPLV